MCEKYVERPLYLLIADWMMAENRWITAREISRQFDIEHCKAINTLSYILSEVGEIVCEVKMIPNQICRTRLPVPASGESREYRLSTLSPIES
ncbi:transcriptional activator CaiF [Salmonella enterica subsp. enterica]|uniref:Transcriptional activator CaiF n=1 Tax=Salmonella enterica I TaxID=59201 RepID=A0A3S4HW56_SALET|nr:transcriptional activator CaiF [Salmonella enterica subsp. enterica]